LILIVKGFRENSTSQAGKSEKRKIASYSVFGLKKGFSEKGRIFDQKNLSE